MGTGCRLSLCNLVLCGSGLPLGQREIITVREDLSSVRIVPKHLLQ